MIDRLKALKNHEGFMRYFKNTSWLFGEKILRTFVNLFVGVWVARYLGPERFGLFSYAQSFVGLFAVIATLGLGSIVVRELVKDEGRRDELIGTSFWLRLVGALGMLAVLAAAVRFTSNDAYTNTLILIVASAAIFQSLNVIEFYYQAKVLSKYIVYANVVSLFLSSVVKIALILYRAPLIAFAWTMVFDSAVLALGFLYFYLKTKPKLNVQHSAFSHWRFDKRVALSLLKDSWPLILSGMVVAVYMKIDQVMIKELMDNEAVGQYAAAVRISEAWYFIPAVISSSLFPAIINAKKQSEKLYHETLQRLYDLMVWMAVAIALPMTFISKWLVHIIYGGQYDQAGSVLMIHIWTGVFVFLGAAFGKFMVIENYTTKTFYRHSVGAVINVALNYILIPRYGINGAAVATLLGQFVANYAYDFFDPDLRHQLVLKTKSFFPIHILRGYH